ncbi:hypothetical protein BDR04DRAFT_1119096 [Suillus decipiens]|nr:hypothetical protein BDR04DRAFT_1119096 [Suillus decipiens]
MESLLKVPLILSSAIALHAFYWAVSFVEIAIIVHRTTDPNSSSIIRDTPITFLFVFGTALAVTGGLVRWWCYRTLGRFFTFQLSIREGQYIVTTGPYAIIRHPSYTAGLVVLIGILILHGSTNSWLRQSGALNIPELKVIVAAWLAEITLLSINVVLRVSQEDEILKSTFRDEWERWATTVRYRLIPGIY